MDIWKHRKLLIDALSASQAKKGEPWRGAWGKDFHGTIVEGQRDVGVLGGGVLALSRARRKPVLLYAPEVQRMLGINVDIEAIVTTQTDYDRCGELKELIDLLFLVARDTDVPEFVRLIQEQEQNPFEFPFEHDLREEYQILHCSPGEIMAFCLYWKMLMGIIHHLGGASHQYPSCLEGLSGARIACTLDTWTSCVKDVKGCEVESKMLRYFKRVVEQSAAHRVGDEHWQRATRIHAGIEESILTLDFSGWQQTADYARDLGITTHPNDWSAFVGYVTEVLKIHIPSDKPEGEGWAAFGSSYFKYFTELVLGVHQEQQIRLAGLLEELHHKVRFPLIAYSHILLLDKHGNKHGIKAKEHLAFPVWHSFDPSTLYPFPGGGEERSVMYCLYTIEPPDQWRHYSLLFGPRGDANVWEAYKLGLGRTIDELSALVNPYVDRAYYSDENKKNVQSILSEAKRAAISQVLARTMSHNLGSHSLNALATEQAMSDLLKHLLLRIDRSRIPGRISGESPPEWKDAIDQFTEWLARYNNYLRERMDFLADITTAVPAFETRTPLVQGLLKGYAENHLLTTTIAGSPDFDYCWDPIINPDVNGRSTKEDILVSIPSDVLGRHALYVIMENVVRNSSKHGAHPTGNPVSYSVKVEKVKEGKHSDMLKVTIQDDKEGRLSEEHEAYKVLDDAGKKNAWTIEGLVRERNASIKDKVLGEDGRVRTSAWGMLEMKACAAYLRRVALEELDEEKYHPKGETDEQLAAREELPLLEAVHNEDGFFGYAFYLLRPKDVMVIGEKVEALFPSLDAKAKERLPEFGIGLLGLDELVNQPVINHGLLVFQKSSDEGLRRFIRHLLDDPNAMSHEILIVGGDCKEAVRTALGEQSAHANHPLVESTVFATEDLTWPAVEAKAIGVWGNALRRTWLLAKLAQEEKQLLSTNTNLNEDLDGSIYAAQAQTIDGSFKLNVDYATHSGADPFYVEIARRTSTAPSTAAPWRATDDNGRTVDHDARVLASMEAEQHFVLRYPSALDRVMRVWKERTDPVTTDRLSLHHMAYWLSNTAVVDERIQESVHASTYSPQVEAGQANEVIQVKHLLDFAGVFVPFKSEALDLHSKEYTAPMWSSLKTWLGERRRHLSYAYVHLSVLEKFASQAVIGSVEDGLAQLRALLPRVRFVIVSGRGKPPSLPKGELFVSYSALNQYLTQPYQRSPLLLNILSHSARRLT